MSKRSYEDAMEARAAPMPPSAVLTTSSTLCISDMLPPIDKLDFYVVIETPQFLKTLAKSLNNVLQTATIWVRNTRSRLAREHAAGKNLTQQGFSGLGVDSADQSRTFMAIARIPLPGEKVVINKFQAGVQVDEVGVTLDTKQLVNSISDIKEFQQVVLYKLRDEEKLVVYHVSLCRDPFSYEVPLKYDLHEHAFYPTLDIAYELTLPAGTLQEAISRQKSSDSKETKFQLRRWLNGLTFVVKPNFTAMQVLFAPLLSKHMSADSVAIMRRLDDAKKRFDAMDPVRPLADRRLECGMDAVEDDVRTALFQLYDTCKVPAGFVKPPRRASAATPVAECEIELRELFAAAHAAFKRAGAIDEGDASTLGMHVAMLETVSTYTHAIADAPVRQDIIDSLELLYSVSISTKLLADIFKQTSSATVMMAIPAERTRPLSIKYDLGATNSDAFITWILAPIIADD